MPNLECFYATMKLTTSEEILAEVMPQEEDGTEFFVLSNPIIISETMQIDQEKGVAISGLVPRKWMLYANEDMTIAVSYTHLTLPTILLV